MNEYFRDKVLKLKENVRPNLAKSLSYTERYFEKHGNIAIGQSLSFKNICWSDVLDHIDGLKSTNAIGEDDIGTIVLKKYKNALCPVLVHILNLCLTQSKYPSLWKCGLISPIPKKGDLTQMKNWRPIVLNCSMSKILERIMNPQIQDYLRQFQLSSPYQHAYQTAKS